MSVRSPSYKDLLVHVADDRARDKRIETAIALAQAHGAHLVGLHADYEVSFPGYVEVRLSAEIVEAQMEAARERAREAKAAFTRLTERAGLAAEWRSVNGDPARTLSLHARYADLVITAQTDTGDPGSPVAAVSDKVALESGRPVLVIPYIGAPSTMGRRIMVAWNASREATRAVHDALPLLTRAEAVKIIAINPGSHAGAHGDVPGADIALHLARHGVRTEAYRIEAGDLGVGDMLLSRTADDGMDLIVMGCYGHSRVRELVLGGATRHLLEHMTVPVLMAH